MAPNYYYVSVSSIGFGDFGIHRATCGSQSEAEAIARSYASRELTRWAEVILVREDAWDIKSHGCLQEVVARFAGN